MSAARDSRPSEQKFNSVILMVRNMDKLLWLGKDHHSSDICEYADSIATALREVSELFCKEVNMPVVPTQVAYPDAKSPHAATIEPAAPPMSKEPTNDLSFLD